MPSFTCLKNTLLTGCDMIGMDRIGMRSCTSSVCDVMGCGLLDFFHPPTPVALFLRFHYGVEFMVPPAI